MTTLDFGLARWDLGDGWRRLDLAWGLAVRDLKARYARSALGPAWITLTMAIYVGVVGIVFGGLFGANLRDIVPWIALGLIAWTFFSSVLLEAVNVLEVNRSLMLQTRLSVSTLVLVVVLRNLLVVAHHLLLYAGLVALGFVPLSATALLVLPALAIAAAAAFGLGLAAAILGGRYRDLPPLFASLVTLGLLATPIMWRPADLQRFHEIAAFNPMAHLVAVVREPLLGRWPEPQAWIWAAGTAAILLALGALALARGRRTITFWI